METIAKAKTKTIQELRKSLKEYVEKDDFGMATGKTLGDHLLPIFDILDEYDVKINELCQEIEQLKQKRMQTNAEIWNDIKSYITELSSETDRDKVTRLICVLHNKIVDYHIQKDFKLKTS